MDTINLIQTNSSPKVLLDPVRGVIVFKGRSTMEDARAFYQPLVEWMNEYVKLPQNTSIVIDLEYFNTTTNKFLQTLFYILSKNQHIECSVIVYWMYDKDDEDIWETGHEFSNRSEIEFVFIERVNYDIKRIEINETEVSPKVILDPVSGVINIEGKSNNVDPKSFYAPIIDWLGIYVKEPKDTTVSIGLENVNVVSGRFLQLFFTMISDVRLSGHSLIINWVYNRSDNETWALGQEYSKLCELEFNFIELS